MISSNLARIPERAPQNPRAIMLQGGFFCCWPQYTYNPSRLILSSRRAGTPEIVFESLYHPQGIPVYNPVQGENPRAQSGARRGDILQLIPHPRAITLGSPVICDTVFESMHQPDTILQCRTPYSEHCQSWENTFGFHLLDSTGGALYATIRNYMPAPTKLFQIGQTQH